MSLLHVVVYILQIVHWNPDKTTGKQVVGVLKQLCISFKLFIEILIKQLSPQMTAQEMVVYILQIVHWNPDKTTKKLVSWNVGTLCISFKLFIEILIKQQIYGSANKALVVYILQIVHWNPDKTTRTKWGLMVAQLCISFKLFIEILIKQPTRSCNGIIYCCVYPSNCSLKSW